MGALFTGRTPSLEWADGERLHWNGHTWCGLTRLAAGADDSCIPRSVPTLAEGMRALGYRTVGVVANELMYRPGGFERGFDEWIKIAPEIVGFYQKVGLGSARKAARRRSAKHVNGAVLKALDEQPKDQPLFLYVHYIDVHEYAILGRPYVKSVEAFDASLGRLLDQLEARGFLRDTLVVLTSDHGEALGEEHGLPSRGSHFGNPSFQPVLEVPLIASWRVAEDASGFVRSQDLYGLVLRAAGGRDTAPRDVAPDERFLSEHEYQTYRRGRWKSTRRRDGGAIALFDLDTDPGEVRNVAAEHPEILAEHRERLDELTGELSARGAQPTTLSSDDEKRLRLLGYIE